jgi:hypothetical protein
MHSYEWIDPETAPVRRVKRDDGVVFEVERHVHHANLQGHIAEQWLRDGSVSVTKPYVAPVKAKPVPDDHARRARRDATDVRSRR